MLKLPLLLFFLFSCGFVFSHSEGGESVTHLFEENKGQWHDNVKFKAEMLGVVVFYEANSIHFQLSDRVSSHPAPDDPNKVVHGHVYKALYLNSNPNPNIEKINSSKTYYNYFIGNDESKWASRVRKYKQLNYENLYNGIDVSHYLSGVNIKTDYKVFAGSNPNQIKMEYEGIDNIKIENGNLILTHSLGNTTEKEPFAYQLIENVREAVPCNYVLNEDGSIGFNFPNGYDSNLELIIDPELVFSTYSGSKSNNFGMTATYDFKKNGYMGGTVYGDDYISTVGAYDTKGDPNNSNTLVDIGIAKIAANGIDLLFATYLGGTRNETVHSMVVDKFNNLYILGASASTNFPTTNKAFDKSKSSSKTDTTDVNLIFRGGSDIVVTKFTEEGDSLLGSTYFGGNGLDGINLGINYGDLNYNYGDDHRGEIIVDDDGNCYIGTVTRSDDLDTSISKFQGVQDGLIVKFGTDLDTVIWSRYLGGSQKDAIYSLKVIKNNRVLVGGGTISYIDFPTTTGSYQENANKGTADGFISIISSDGKTVEKSTFIGTDSYDQVYFIEYDRFEGIYAYGQTNNINFPLKNAPVADTGSGQFFIKLDKNLDSLEYSTTFGSGNGTVNISPTAFLVDRCQNVYASGWGGNLNLVLDQPKTLPTNMPLANNDPAYSTTDRKDFYLYVLNREVDSILYASYFGGTNSEDHIDGGTSRFDAEGVIYQSVCASCGTSTNDFPNKNAYSTTDNSVRGNGTSGCNNALFKFDFEILSKAGVTVGQQIGCTPFTTTITDTSKILTEATVVSWDFYGTPVNKINKDTTITFTQEGTFSVRQIIKDTICDFADTAIIFFTAYPNDVVLEVGNDTVVCNPTPFNLVAKTNGTANRFIWSTNSSFTDTLNNTADSSLTVQPSSDTLIFYVKASQTLEDPCEKIDSVRVINSQLSVEASISDNTVCIGNSVDLNSTLENIDKFKWIYEDGTIDSTNQNPTKTYLNSGDYNIKLVGTSFQCNKSDTAFLNLKVLENLLFLDKIADTFTCLNAEIELIQNSNGTATSFLWSSSPIFNDTLNNYPTDSSIKVSQTASPNFFIKMSDGFCEKEDTVQYEHIIYELDLVDLLDTSCTPYSEQLKTTIIGLDSFRIFLGNGLSTNIDSTPQITFTTEGEYLVELIGSNEQCEFIDTLRQIIQVYENVNLTSLTDTTICLGDTIILMGNSSGTAQEFFWDTDNTFPNPLNNSKDSSIQLSPNETTTFYLKGQNVVCEDVEPITITTEIVDIEVEDRSICIKDTLQLEAIVIEASTPLDYTWSPNDSIISGQSTNAITVTPKSDITFSVIAVSQTGCEDYDTVDVRVNLPEFTEAEILTSRDSIFKGEETVLSTNRNTGNLVYEWEPTDDFNNPTAAQPILTVDESKEYKVTITDLSTGCIVEAFRRLFVFEVNCGEPDIFIPTAFTPNNDLRNDILYIRGANLESLSFQLFNRWGELVFETSDKNIGWDGIYKGKEVDPGVFAYQLKAICFDGQEFFKKGNITLIR